MRNIKSTLRRARAWCAGFRTLNFRARRGGDSQNSGRLRKHYEKYHGVSYKKGVMEYAVHMSARYINERFLPDKAIDLIDEAGAYRKLHPLPQKKQTVGKEVIDEILSKTCRIPKKVVESGEIKKLAGLERRLSACVFGQDEAIKEVVNAIKFSRQGSPRRESPWPASCL